MRTLVIGGAACGKSEYAEALAIQCPEPRCYIATLIPQDGESMLRIKKHQSIRAKKGFSTIEQYTDLSGLCIPKHGTVLLECLGNLTANELFSAKGAGSNTYDAILHGIEKLEVQCDSLIVVTNDVFADDNAYTYGTLRYIEILAALNRTLAQRFERVVELVCGIPILQKGVYV